MIGSDDILWLYRFIEFLLDFSVFCSYDIVLHDFQALLYFFKHSRKYKILRIKQELLFLSN